MQDDMFMFFFQCTSWLSSLIDLAIAAAAFGRLRNTPAGLLIGGGFTLMGLFGVATRLVTLVMRPDRGDLTADFDTWMVQSSMINTVNTCGVMLFMSVVGVGFFLLPKSLAKLAEGANDATE